VNFSGMNSMPCLIWRKCEVVAKALEVLPLVDI
jgi:hypothetical protein